MNLRNIAANTARTALITGAASGIGRATAEEFASKGWSLVLIDTHPDIAAVAAELATPGQSACAIQASVADDATWKKAVTILSGLPPLRAFVNNAYTVDLAPIGELSRESWNAQIDVNLTAAFLGTKALLPALTAAQEDEERSSVVFISSVHARMGLPGRPAYAATKGALVALAQQLAVEYGSQLRVNSVLPGPIVTAAWREFSQEDLARSADATALERLGRPAEVASAIHFLCSPEASFITGAALPVDGGWLVKKDSV